MSFVISVAGRRVRAQRENWELLGDGEGIHWPELDEDISVAGLLRGAQAAG